MDFLFGGYDEKKLRANLKMSVHRIKLQHNKESNLTKVNKKNIAKLLQEGKVELARIKTEQIIRTDDLLEAYGILELILEILHERIHYISASTKDVPDDLKESISSIVFAAKRLGIEELATCSKHFKYKFGAEFIEMAEKNEGNCVNERLFNKISLLKIKAKLVNGYLQEIAKTYQVEYEDIETGEEGEGDMPAPTGTSVPIAPASNLTSAYAPTLVLQQPIHATAIALGSNDIDNDYYHANDGSGIGSGNGSGNGRERAAGHQAADGFHSGETDAEGRPHGAGSFEYTDGGYYDGNFFKGMRHGKGTMNYQDGSKYTGDFFDDRRQGVGELSLINGGNVLHRGKWWMGEISNEAARRRVEAVMPSPPEQSRSPAPSVALKSMGKGQGQDEKEKKEKEKEEREEKEKGKEKDDGKEMGEEEEEEELEEEEEQNKKLPAPAKSSAATSEIETGKETGGGDKHEQEPEQKPDGELDALAARLAALRK